MNHPSRPNRFFLFTRFVIGLVIPLSVLPGAWGETGVAVWTSFFRSGGVNQALEAFTRAAEENPEDGLAYAGLAYLSPSRTGEAEALRYFQKALLASLDQPEGALFLMEAMHRASQREEYESLLTCLDTALASGRASESLKALLIHHRGDLLKKLGRWDDARAAFGSLNLITGFWYCGPFDNAEKGGHTRIFGPEENLDLNATYSGRRQTVGWRPVPAEPFDGYIDLHGILSPSVESTAYLAAVLESPQEQRCRLSLGHAGALKVWLNGELIADVNRYHDFMPDQVNLAVNLAEGPNTLLLKVSSGKTGRYGIQVRAVPEASGSVTVPSPLSRTERPDLTAHTPQHEEESSMRINFEPILVRQVEAKGEAAGFSEVHPHFFYALLIQRWQIADENDPGAHTLLSQLAKMCPQNPLLLRALGDSEKEANRRRLAYETVMKTDPDDLACFLRLLRYDQNSPYATKGYERLRAWGQQHDLPAQARLIQAHLWNADGLREAAIAQIRDLTQELGNEARWALYDWNGSHMTDAAKEALLQEILAEDATESRAVHALRSLALRRGEEDKLPPLLEHERHIAPFSIAGLIEIAQYKQARGDFTASLDYLEQARRIAPEDYETHRLSAIAYHHLGNGEQALAAIQAALASRPSDPWCLDYLEYLQPEEESYATPYLIDWKTIQAPDSLDLSKANHLVLLHQRVVKVHQNGNSSETVREAVKILTETGIRYNQVRGIYYEGGSEDVRIIRARVWKPDGTFYDAPAAVRRSASSASDAAARLYGDYNVAILQFQALEKGAVLELEYKKESKGDNVYADYFGDQFFIGNEYFEPTVRTDYVLITPQSRNIYWKFTGPHYPPSIAGQAPELEPEPAVTGSGLDTVHHWSFQNLPTVPREPYMPAASEILPYIKVSTFKTWSDMTEWYWNLMKDQVRPGAVTKDRVTQIVAQYREKHLMHSEETLSEWDRVRAVNQFVNTGVRYLGLEFGIHGYKPHKVDEICNAQYGDCKDKAVLAIAMLKELGIEAHMALLRTTDRGEIDYELPSLGIFNHAIYYLPNLNGKEYWIDGTATFFDAAELPPGDMGANSLIIKPGGQYEFKRIPYSKPEETGALYTTSLTLDAEGNAQGYRAAEFRGLYNPITRRTYENTAKTKEVIDRQLMAAYPGAESANIELSDLQDYSKDERLVYEFRIPQFAVQQGGRWIVPTTLFKEKLSPRYTQLSSREYDLVLSYPYTRTNMFTIELPATMRSPQIPEDRSLASEFGSFLRQSTFQDGKIFIKEELVFKPVRVPKDQYQDFREFCRLADLYQDETISIPQTNEPENQ